MAKAERITRREWRVIAEAIGFRLAGDYDEDDVDAEALESAHRKATVRGWPGGSVVKEETPDDS